MRWSEFVERVRERGEYPTGREAERVSRTVLPALAGQLDREERDLLARRLPPEAARLVTARGPATPPLPAAAFVDAIAARTEGATPATARWDTSSVLSVVADAMDRGELDRLMARLPGGYALLFGRARLVPDRPAREAEPV
ncbi:DUF2267 domain-containing protein [Streptomyces zingiberis]|uniref:DUF2267 domain-containing protein n=1 Tax=Streptomyces zingiberis TaxID=2053010 RepID=A0ABX1BZB7_9ACTN|nr:DUF2267 domain-containing protein [Streptomyces zingiberis]NJQ01668.1 DUF2267 domain-containing protein [Streptomyces zingiberis]